MSPSTESCSHHHDPTGGCNHSPISPAHFSQQKITRLLLVATLVLAFAILEFGVGVWSHSVALFADAGHLLVDCGAVLLALGAAWWSQRRPELASQKLEVWAALVNGVALVAIAFWIGYEAVESLRSPPVEILSLPMLITAGVGLGVNSLNAKLLHQHSHDDLNVRGVLLHAIADAASSFGILIAALAITLFHWQRADGVVSLAVASLILLGALPLIQASLTRLSAVNTVPVEPQRSQL